MCIHCMISVFLTCVFLLCTGSVLRFAFVCLEGGWKKEEGKEKGEGGEGCGMAILLHLNSGN